MSILCFNIYWFLSSNIHMYTYIPLYFYMNILFFNHIFTTNAYTHSEYIILVLLSTLSVFSDGLFYIIYFLYILFSTSEFLSSSELKSRLCSSFSIISLDDLIQSYGFKCYLKVKLFWNLYLIVEAFTLEAFRISSLRLLFKISSKSTR